MCWWVFNNNHVTLRGCEVVIINPLLWWCTTDVKCRLHHTSLHAWTILTYAFHPSLDVFRHRHMLDNNHLPSTWYYLDFLAHLHQRMMSYSSYFNIFFPNNVRISWCRSPDQLHTLLVKGGFQLIPKQLVSKALKSNHNNNNKNWEEHMTK